MIRSMDSILVLGDSLSKGVTFNEVKRRYCVIEDSYVNLVKNFIQPRVLNVSRFGATVDFGKKAMAQKFDVVNPDVVFIEFGGNDCDFDWEAIAQNPERDYQPRTALKDFEASLRAIIENVRTAGKLSLIHI